MQQTKKIVWAGIVLIFLTGAVHFIEAPDHFMEIRYLGWMFIANGVASLIAAYGIFKRKFWGWLLGLLVAGGAMVGYAMSRTVGMPGMEREAWLEFIGVVSLIVEALFLLLAVKVLFKGVTKN